MELLELGERHRSSPGSATSVVLYHVACAAVTPCYELYGLSSTEVVSEIYTPTPDWSSHQPLVAACVSPSTTRRGLSLLVSQLQPQAATCTLNRETGPGQKRGL